MRRWRKKGGDDNGLGRSCGGFSTKIHAVADALGNPLDFMLTGGQVHDSQCLLPLVTRVMQRQETPANCLADRGYDSDKILAALKSWGIEAIIPPKKNRKVQRDTDWHWYSLRHSIEDFFGHLKYWRGITTRFDKTATAFQARLHAVAALFWLK